MSLLRRTLYRKKLTKLLEAADDEEFFAMVWATHAAQTGRAAQARRFLEGVFQIWRFVAHHRRGLHPGHRLQTGIRGVVVTLDSWLSAPSSLREEVMNLAKARADRDPGITDADRIPVLFCPIDDLEYTLNATSHASFFQTLEAIGEERFLGWGLSSMHREIAPDVDMANGYPFQGRVAEVLPWWDQFGPRRRRMGEPSEHHQTYALAEGCLAEKDR